MFVSLHSVVYERKFYETYRIIQESKIDVR